MSDRSHCNLRGLTLQLFTIIITILIWSCNSTVSQYATPKTLMSVRTVLQHVICTL